MSAHPIGPVIEDPAHVVHRQVRPAWVQGGRVTSQVWKCEPLDEGLLSLADGEKRTPQAAYEFHRSLGFDSVGTLSTTVGMFKDLCVTVSHDAYTLARDRVDDPHHVCADLRRLTNSEGKRLASKISELKLPFSYQRPEAPASQPS